MATVKMQTFNLQQGPVITSYSGYVTPLSDGTVTVDARDVGTMQVLGFTVINAVAESPTYTNVTISSLTSGSVLFAGAGGVLSQDNANFFWDATNHRLGIGNAVPNGRFVLTVASLAASNGNAGVGAFRITTGTGLSTDSSLIFGVHDGDYSWIQSVQPAVANRNLVLQGTGGNVGINNLNPQANLSIGTTAGSLGVNNTFTDAANYEVGRFDWNVSNVLTIGTDKNGTGSTRNIQIVVGGTLNTTFGANTVIHSSMPTADPHVVGQLWNSSGTVHISAG